MNISRELFDHSLRVERVIWMAGVPDAEALSSDLKEFFEDTDFDKINELFGCSILTRYPDLVEIEELLRQLYMQRKQGLLVKMATPIPQAFSDDGNGYTTYGFGCYTTEWFYTETLDEAFVERTIEWQEAFIAKKRAAAKNK